MAGKQFDLSVVMRVIDKASNPIKKIANSFKKVTSPVEKLNRTFSRTNARLRMLDSAFAKVERRMTRSGFNRMSKRIGEAGRTFSTRLTLPIAIFGALTIRSGIAFQKAMNMVGAVTRATGEEFKVLEKLAKDLGASTQFSASEAAEGMQFLGMAGLTVKEIIGALPRTLELAASAQMDLGTAADIVTNIMSGYRMQTEELAKANDVLVNAFTSSNTDLQQLGEGMKVVGPVAKGLQFRFTETAAALGILAKNAFQGTLGGTGLRRIMTNLMSPSKTAIKMFKALGISVKNSDGSLKDITGVLKEFEKAQAKGVDEMILAQVAMEAFGQRGGPQFLALMGAGSDALKKFEENLHETGTSAKVAEAQMKRLPGAFKLLVSAFEAVQLAIIDSGFGRFIDNLTRSFALFMQQLSETNPTIVAIATVIAGVAAAIGPLLLGIALFGKMLAFIGASTAVATFLSIAGSIIAIGTAVAGVIFSLDKLFDYLANPLIKGLANLMGIKIINPEAIGEASAGGAGVQGLTGAQGLAGASGESNTQVGITVTAANGASAVIDGTKSKGPVKPNIIMNSPVYQGAF